MEACWGLNANRWKQQTVWQEPFRWNKVVVLPRGPRSVHLVSQLWLDHGKGMPCHHSEWYSGRREHTSWSITTPNIAVWDDSIPSGDSLPSAVLWKHSDTFPNQRCGGGRWESGGEIPKNKRLCVITSDDACNPFQQAHSVRFLRVTVRRLIVFPRPWKRRTERSPAFAAFVLIVRHFD